MTKTKTMTSTVVRISKKRKQIDTINHKIASLIISRAKISKQIKLIKKRNHIKLIDSSREKQMLKSFVSSFPNKLKPEAKQIFNIILKVSKKY